MNFSPEVLTSDLLKLQGFCSERRLTDAAKWAAEMLMYIPEVGGGKEPETPPAAAQTLKGRERKILLFAQSCMDAQEFRRAASFTKHQREPLLKFLHYYSLYLAGEKERLDSMADVLDKTRKFENQELAGLYKDLSGLANQSSLAPDPFLSYLHGLVLNLLNFKLDAMAAFTESVELFPCFWPSWLELAKVVTSREQLEKLKLPECWMKQLFLVELFMRLQLDQEALQLLETLFEQGLADCPYLKTKIALIQHNQQKFDEAAATFKQVFEQDKFRFDHVDIYSNTLFVRGSDGDPGTRLELANLAHHCFKVNKYSPETCCVVGNYYGTRLEHEKAIQYWQRALKLDPSNTHAWVIMGHEFLELKNTPAASVAYRKALEIDPYDSRAWYALGQLYEYLKLHTYSIYYYNLAHKYKPQDSRFLMGLGETLEKNERYEDAKKCFWKAHCIGDVEGHALFKLAELLAKRDEKDQAASCYRMFLDKLAQQELDDDLNQAKCYRFLCDYCFENQKLEEAQVYAQSCLDYQDTKEHGKSVLKKVSQLQGTTAPDFESEISAETSGSVR